MTNSDIVGLAELKPCDEILRDYESGAMDAAGTIEDLVAIIDTILSLKSALAEIREAVSRRQLPITNQVYEIADAALSGSPEG